MSRSLVLASGNAGKLKELRELLAPLELTLTPQSELGVGDVPETGLTFVENALIKARYAARITGQPVIADDSGIAVDALGGQPGIYSARYAGRHGDNAANNERLLAELADYPDTEQRRAQFRCVLVLLRTVDDPVPIITEGIWHGHIVNEPRGSEGFGYDPLFADPASGLTGAELPASEKNRISHRGQAIAKLVERLRHEF